MYDNININYLLVAQIVKSNYESIIFNFYFTRVICLIFADYSLVYLF